MTLLFVGKDTSRNLSSTLDLFDRTVTIRSTWRPSIHGVGTRRLSHKLDRDVRSECYTHEVPISRHVKK